VSQPAPPGATPSPRAPAAAVTRWHTNRQRIRYSEVDRMGYLWHGHYLALFEEARTDWLRALGFSYKALEDAGVWLVVVEAGVRYLRPGQFEDELEIRCRPVEAAGATLRIEYEIVRGRHRLATGHTLLASTDTRGRPCRLPPFLRALVASAEGTEAPGAGVQAPGPEGP
jgi:acyl-CoA thioester hydrolase